jgi:glycine/D-amino acid oxidase-like deaminating enzyme
LEADRVPAASFVEVGFFSPQNLHYFPAQDSLRMHAPARSDPWGNPPWRIDFAPDSARLPRATDFAVIGGGFTGLAAAAWLRRTDPAKSVVVLEASHIGSGASGRTGGMVLAETAAGDAPGLGDVLSGLKDILRKLEVECDLTLPGAWEVARAKKALRKSPIDWNDSGRLGVTGEVPGGTLDPGKLVSGLARAAHRLGATIVENHPVRSVEWRRPPIVRLNGTSLRANIILFATNALSLEVSGLGEGFAPRLTFAVATEPLRENQLESIGLAERKPFYTSDLPYLWGRVHEDNSVIWGSGLASAPGSRDLHRLTIDAEEPARLLASLEARVRRLHPELKGVRFTHRWGGPILFRESWLPVFDRHPQSKSAIVLGAYAGHGVALSSYLAAWAAEVLVGRRDLPHWGRIGG